VYIVKDKDGKDYIYKLYERPRSFWREAFSLSEFDHPFIIKPVCINSEQRGLLMPFLEQGDLTKLPRDFSETKLKKFMAQMIVAVNELHKRGYVHADLKMGNIGRTLEPFDHIVLLDFGLAMPTKEIITDVGTESMMAPEMTYPDVFLNELHEGVDWWSLGATYWQLNCRAKRLRTTFPKDDVIPVNDTAIVSRWSFPDQFDYSLRDLIMRLMPLDSDLRKFSSRGIEKLKQHPFFNGIDWSSLMSD
jgi:serine/threonine protein kinase